jgi:hypothetical protein
MTPPPLDGVATAFAAQTTSLTGSACAEEIVAHRPTGTAITEAAAAMPTRLQIRRMMSTPAVISRRSSDDFASIKAER